MNGRMVCLLALLLTPLASAQGIYKWVDAQGQVHYGEAPPEDAQTSQVTVKTPPAAPVAEQDRTESTRRVLQSFEEERARKDEAATKQAKETADRKRQCALANDRLRSYQEAGYLYNLDKTGERRVLGDAEHASAMKTAEAEVKTYCK